MNKGSFLVVHFIVLISVIAIMVLAVIGAIEQEEMVVNECAFLGLSSVQCAAVRSSYSPATTIDCLHEGGSIRECYIEHQVEIYE